VVSPAAPRRRVVSALDRKLLRDLWSSRGQAVAIALVVAAGIAVFVAMLSTYDSLDLSLRTYYERYRFADVFLSLTRAPQSLQSQIAAIPGVAQVETRVVEDVTLDVPGMTEPATGRLISMTAGRRPPVCDVFLRSGRLIDCVHPDEVVASESFARAHRLREGDAVGAVINGRRRELRIVGLVLSPEYVYPIRPGELLPDDAHFGVFWMERRALASAFQMDGAFNDVVLTLMHGASQDDVIARLDRLIGSSYGATGAVPRALQPSNWYLANELKGLRASAFIVPVIFLGVALFLVNVVLSRTVAVQRTQVAAIKALGYSNAAIAAHYVKWSLIVAVLGGAAGVGLGAWLGWALTRLYTVFFHFPVLLYRLNVQVSVLGLGIAVLAAVVGAIGAVRRAVALPPAEAMRPEPPASYSESWPERAGLRRWLSQPTRIILRTVQRHPARAAMSMTGIALGASLLVVGDFSGDAVDVMIRTEFDVAQRYDVMVTLVQPGSAGALHELSRLPGVIHAEPFRAIPVRLRSGPRSRTVGVMGVLGGGALNRVVDASQGPIELPPAGLVLSAALADLLGVRRGDRVRMEVLEGARPARDVTVVDVVHEYLGTNAYMDLEALHRLMEEGQTLSGAYLQVDGAKAAALYRRLEATPRVAGVLRKRSAIESIQGTLATMMRQIQLVYVLFASVIAFGVVYNSVRISLSERSRELATLRVIGFTRAEVSYILLGEVGLETLAAVPVGLVLGYGLAAATVRASNSEMFRIPLVVSPATYALAATTIVVATIASALAVRRQIDRLDLVEVLKTRE
jgi:putative ABC transport system permease protein